MKGMKKMKKIRKFGTLVALGLSAVLCLSACGGKEESGAGDNSNE